MIATRPGRLKIEMDRPSAYSLSGKSTWYGLTGQVVNLGKAELAGCKLYYLESNVNYQSVFNMPKIEAWGKKTWWKMKINLKGLSTINEFQNSRNHQFVLCDEKKKEVAKGAFPRYLSEVATLEIEKYKVDLSKSKKQSKRFNISVFGRAGSGKSSTINSFFTLLSKRGFSVMKYASHGSAIHITKDIQVYPFKSSNFTIFEVCGLDSKNWEPDKVRMMMRGRLPVGWGKTLDVEEWIQGLQKFEKASYIRKVDQSVYCIPSTELVRRKQFGSHQFCISKECQRSLNYYKLVCSLVGNDPIVVITKCDLVDKEFSRNPVKVSKNLVEIRARCSKLLEVREDKIFFGRNYNKKCAKDFNFDLNSFRILHRTVELAKVNRAKMYENEFNKDNSCNDIDDELVAGAKEFEGIIMSPLPPYSLSGIYEVSGYLQYLNVDKKGKYGCTLHYLESNFNHGKVIKIPFLGHGKKTYWRMKVDIKGLSHSHFSTIQNSTDWDHNFVLLDENKKEIARTRYPRFLSEFATSEIQKFEVDMSKLKKQTKKFIVSVFGRSGSGRSSTINSFFTLISKGHSVVDKVAQVAFEKSRIEITNEIEVCPFTASNFKIYDISGLDRENWDVAELRMLMKGKLPIGWKKDVVIEEWMEKLLNFQDTPYIRNADQSIFCIPYSEIDSRNLLSINEESELILTKECKFSMKYYRLVCSLVSNPIIVITKCDLGDEEFGKNPLKVSIRLKKMKTRCAELLSIPEYMVFFGRNYVKEDFKNFSIDLNNFNILYYTLEKAKINRERMVEKIFETKLRRKNFSSRTLQKMSSFLEYDSIDLSQLNRSTRISRGSFGNVFRYKMKLKNGKVKEVAVKLFSGKYVDEGLITDEMIKEEAFNMISATHVNLLQYYGYHLIKRKAKFMELCEISLGDMIREGKLGSFNNKVKLILQLADGMQFLHKTLKVVHKDLKPENVLLTKAGVLKIVHYGDAKKMGELKPHLLFGKWTGTPFFSAPEIIQQGKKPFYDERSDVFSFGVLCLCVYFEQIQVKELEKLLYGGYSISSQSAEIAKMLKKEDWRPVFPKEFIFSTCSKIEKAFVEMILSCFRIDPHTRPSFDDICGLMKSKIS